MSNSTAMWTRRPPPALGHATFDERRQRGIVGRPARAQPTVQRVPLGGRHPQAVAVLDGDLPGDVLAAERGVGRQPRRGVAVALALVRRPVDGHQVQRVIGERPPRVAVEPLRALLPGVGHGHDVVDLHRARRPRPSLERDRRAGERIVQGPGQRHAVVGVRLDLHVDQVAPQDVVARVAAVVPQRHGHVVGPSLPEQVPVVPGFRRAPLGLQGGQLSADRAQGAGFPA
ncbi:hypothetical protein CHAN_00425 [Corynebacterium hansenii]|nr:hypothetical protein CHAN_00425 [Corynebacterium hansenii]